MDGSGGGEGFPDSETLDAIEQLSRYVLREQRLRSETPADEPVASVGKERVTEEIEADFDAGVLWGRWELFRAQVQEDDDEVAELLTEVVDSFDAIDVFEIPAPAPEAQD